MIDIWLADATTTPAWTEALGRVSVFVKEVREHGSWKVIVANIDTALLTDRSLEELNKRRNKTAPWNPFTLLMTLFYRGGIDIPGSFCIQRHGEQS